MHMIEEVLKSKPSFYAASGATEEEISKAESDLTLTFSNEHKNYLSCFGFALFEGYEFTGTGIEPILHP